MKSGATWIELHVLHQHGWSFSALAREFGLNWRTVKREVTSQAPRHYPARHHHQICGTAHFHPSPRALRSKRSRLLLLLLY
jgi:hypothetical protein